MITQLYIKNFAIVKQLDLACCDGMTVLTGETGAGKSIIIDALNLVLGGRIDISLLKSGSEHSEISVVFDLTNIPTAREWLEERDLAAGSECIVRRVIDLNGRSKSSINGVPSPQQLVKALANLLVNIHGQHEQQGLVRKNEQLGLLDKFAAHTDLLEKVTECYERWRGASGGLQKVMVRTNNYQEKLELLNYQIQELTELALSENELEALHREHKALLNAEQILHNCGAAVELLSSNNLVTAQHQLQQFAEINNHINTAVGMVDAAIINAEEAVGELQHYLTEVNLDPECLHEIEQRLNKIYDLARKHHIQPEQVYEYQQNLAAKLLELTGANTELQNLQKKVIELESEYKGLAAKLSASRKKAAQNFNKQVVGQLKLLNMPYAKFKVDFFGLPTVQPVASGLEQVEFLVTTNPDQPLQPLSKIASGGELSRISLAIQVITAQKSNMPTLIFDEVDVGIGGKTAQIVGKLLRQLGEKTQVFCITHLSQVAVHGHHHLLVDKEVVADRTISTVKALTAESRVQEIARMVGGANITKQTLAHAREMLGAVS